MSVARIKKDDVVIVRSGISAGKTGKVLRVMAEKGLAVVDGLNMVTKAVRPSQAKPNGGHIELPAPLKMSNLMPYDADQKKGVRISRVLSNGKRVRKSKASGKILD